MPSLNSTVQNGSGRKRFQILIVDDSAADARLVSELLKNLQHPHEEYLFYDGEEALDFLRRRGRYANAPRPDLILLDMNMPKLSGIEVLSAIKHDRKLGVIPVLMLSNSGSPDDVLRCYESHANVYVQKPLDFDRSARLMKAIELFWMDFAILPPCDECPKAKLNRELPASGITRPAIQ